MADATFRPRPPFNVQAERVKKVTGDWVTDACVDTLPMAIDMAKTLAREFKRNVRVIDVEGRVCWKPLPDGKCTMCRKRPAKVGDKLCRFCRAANRASQAQKTVPPEMACANCPNKYRQEGELCRACARDKGDSRGVKEIQTSHVVDRYAKGSFCPIRPFKPRRVELVDEYGAPVIADVVWNGTA